MLNLEPVEKRQFTADLCYLSKLITGLINCDCLVENLNFRTSNRTRAHYLFNVGQHLTNYSFNSPLSRLPHNFNKVNHLIDPFHESISILKNKLKHVTLPLS